MGFLQQALVYLTVAVVLVPIASRLGLGSVLGYLAGGCIIGPHVIGLVSDVDAIMHFAEFGVVLMLFMIGLELDLQRLWSMRRAVFGGGLLQFGVTAVALFIAFVALGLPITAAVVAGMAMALSSTAIAVQTMNEKHLDKTPVGRTAFSILLFQDIVAIPIIAIVPMLGEVASGESGDGLGALKALGAIVGVVGIGRYLTNPLLRLIAKTGLREVFTAFSLFLVIGIGELMHLADLSMALGAFLAGVLLASSEYRHALETDLEPFKGLLMGLFFISVGMAIDFALFASSPLLVVGLTLGFLMIKLLVLRVISGRLGVSVSQRWLFAALISQGGEFAFVVFGVARGAKVLPGEWDGLLTLAVALSMAMTPLLLVLHERFMQAAPSAKPEEDVEDEGAPVIIAGFGRVGQIVGRFLFASGLKATVLDHDPDQIELLKPFGFRVFYGDATRLDLLHAAGAHHARLLVVAIDDPESSLALVEKARHHFPHLKIIARARNVGHYTALRRLGVELIERETFESSIMMGRRALEELGCPPYEARERAVRFRQNNITMLESLLPVWDNVVERRQLAVQARKELEEQFELERKALAERGIKGWHFDHEVAAPAQPTDEARGV
jgi:glutathione-regulated potassium-efflux system ancillary protein KefC